MKKLCTYRLSLDELLSMPEDLLVLHGSEDDASVEPGDDDTNDTGGDGGNADDKSGDDGDDKPKEDGDDPDPKDKKISSLEEEKQRHYDLRKKAEKRVGELETEIAALKKDGIKDEDLVKQNTDLSTQVKDQAATIQKMALSSAFALDNTYDWVDPTDALALMSREGVEIDEDGSVHGLSSALEKLAKAKPHLLKTGKKPAEKKTPPAKSGDKPGAGGDKPSTAQVSAARRAELAKRYPALARRGR